MVARLVEVTNLVVAVEIMVVVVEQLVKELSILLMIPLLLQLLQDKE